MANLWGARAEAGWRGLAGGRLADYCGEDAGDLRSDVLKLLTSGMLLIWYLPEDCRPGELPASLSYAEIEELILYLIVY